VGTKRTVEGSVHATNVDQEADHCHSLGGLAITQQLVAKDLAGLAAPGHGVDVEVGKALLAQPILLVAVCEFLCVIVEDGFEEIELDVFAPERFAIVLFEVHDLADRVVAVCIVAAAAFIAAGVLIGRLWGRRHAHVIVFGGGCHERVLVVSGRARR
jgi:hypothetical protein